MNILTRKSKLREIAYLLEADDLNFTSLFAWYDFEAQYGIVERFQYTGFHVGSTNPRNSAPDKYYPNPHYRISLDIVNGSVLDLVRFIEAGKFTQVKRDE